jgi:hypothetical protein
MIDIRNRLLYDYATVEETQADQLQYGVTDQYTVEVQPPPNADIPATLDQFVRGITEYQTKWFGLSNTSPIAAYEIRRSNPEKVTYQFTVPSKRLERKLRTNLIETVPGIGFDSGTDGIPISKNDTVGGGLLTVGRADCYPLRTEFDTPPINALTSALHRHAMQDTRIIIQVLFQPEIRRTIRNWRWIRRAYKRLGYLRKNKSDTFPWHDRPATPRERHQADAIEDKAGDSRFQVSIRFLVIGAEEHTSSRVKELGGAFNIFKNTTTGQYLETDTVQTPWESRFIDFADAVRRRKFSEFSLSFQASVSELAGLVSIPDRTEQKNIETAQP